MNQTKEHVYWADMGMRYLVKRFCYDPVEEQG